MCFKRKSWLGHYNGTKGEWLKAYRSARIRFKTEKEPDYKLDGIYWKAQLIIYDEREREPKNCIKATDLLEMLRITDEILNSIKQNE